MRKFTAFFVTLIAVAYFFLVPEDHAAELEFDGLTVGERVAEPPPAPRLPLAPRPVMTTPDPDSAEGQPREAVEPESEALMALGDDLVLAGEAGFDDGRPPPLPGDAAPAETAGTPIAGRVVDASGQAVPGVRVRVEHPYLPEVQGASDPSGAFHLTPAEPRGDLVLATNAWVLLGGRRALRPGVTDDYLLIVAEPVILQGTVLDEAGRPIDGAQIRGFAPSETLVPFGTPALPLDHAAQHGTSDARGSFRIGPVPLLEGTRIEVRVDGYQPQTQALPEDPRAPLTIVLQPY